MVAFGETTKCHCICGDDNLNDNDKCKGNSLGDCANKKKGKVVQDWMKHAHAEFLFKHHNKYNGYDSIKDGLKAKGKSRTKCHHMDPHGLDKGRVYDRLGTTKDNCDGTNTPSWCQAGHAGAFPVTGHCDESQTKHPTAVPTAAPTAIGHDGWGKPKLSAKKVEAIEAEVAKIEDLEGN